MPAPSSDYLRWLPPVTTSGDYLRWLPPVTTYVWWNNWINLFSVKNYKLWNKIKKSYTNLQISTKKFEFTKNMTKSWIKVQNVRNCKLWKLYQIYKVSVKTYKLWDMSSKSLYQLESWHTFDENPNVELFYELPGKKCEHTQKSRSCSPGSPGSQLYFS